MGDKPIIFSAPMVRALLDGRKTQTRRVMGPSNTLFNGRSWTKLHKAQVWAWKDAWVDPGPSPMGNAGPYLKLPWASGDDAFEDTVHRVYPSVQPGDRLYVREAFVAGFNIADETGQPVGDRKVWYRATDAGLTWYDFDSESTLDNPSWKPSIHMPRWASRLALTVTDVRVQRLQDISEADAVAEGVMPICHQWWQGLVRRADGSRGMMETGGADGPPPSDFESPELQTYERSARDGFCDLWNSLHGPDAWGANPWAVALTFDVHRGNIDHMQEPGK